MANFLYRAKNRTGQIVTGVLVGDSRAAVIERLSGMGLTPLELTTQEAIDQRSSKYLLRKRVRKADVSRFMKQLADLLNAGVPLTKSLTTLTNQQSNPYWKTIIQQIKNSVVAGSSLANALAEYPKIFSELQVNLVKAGEISGSLESVLSRIAEFLEKEQNLIARVKAALAYPILLFIVGTASVAFLLTFFIPKFAVLFADLGQSLPIPTLILLSISGWLRSWWILLLLVISGSIILFRRWVKTKSGKYRFDEFKLVLPIVRDIVVKIAVSRFCRTLGTLLRSGIPLLTALQSVKDATGNEIIAREIGEVAGSIREGQSLAEPLRLSRIFPPSVVEMIAVGEEAGNLEEVLIRIAESYDTEVDNTVRVLVSLLEPVMIICMACIIGFIVISMLLPIFSLNSMIK
ncbi:MAG: type II secretion system F family protein [bacterium]|nr:type II secretion system F family protein [bacterium]